MNAQDTRRYHGFDLVRLASFVAIAFFHISLIHYYEHDVPLSRQSVLSSLIEVYARSLAFSGFTIIFLTSVLTGYSGSDLAKRLRLFTFLALGWVVFSLLMRPYYGTFLAWDVYPLIILGIITSTLCERMGRRWSVVTGFLGFAMLWFPFWELGETFTMSEPWRNVLGFASCQNEVAEWPVLPWLGLIWSGYAAGCGLKRVRAKGAEQTLAMTKGEALGWAVGLAAGATQWGPFYRLTLGDRFSCEAYRMAPHVFWGHFIWPVFLMRLAVVPAVQARLARSRLAHWVSDLAISRRFWVAYIANYLLAHLLSVIVNASGVESTPYSADAVVFAAVVFLPLTELTTRLVGKVVTRAKNWYADDAPIADVAPDGAP